MVPFAGCRDQKKDRAPTRRSNPGRYAVTLTVPVPKSTEPTPQICSGLTEHSDDAATQASGHRTLEGHVDAQPSRRGALSPPMMSRKLSPYSTIPVTDRVYS